MRIIIVGCGRLGSGLAQTMVLQGHQVTVVDRDPQAFDRLGPRFKGKTVTGVGFDRGVLEEAGIQRADGLAAVTASDEANVIIGRIARQIYRVPKVVARLYNPDQAEVYDRLGLQTIAPITWGVHRIADLLTHLQIETISNIGSADVNMAAIEAPHMLVGRTVNAITVPGEIQVIGVLRGGHTLLPTQGTVFKEGDIIYLAVMAASMARLDQILGSMTGGS